MKQSSFGRDSDTRNLLIRNLVTSVLLYESVITTEAKARAVKPIIDRIIRTAQTKDKLTARRLLHSYLLDKNAVNKVLDELANRMSDRTSGFTRTYNVAPRAGDGAPRVVIQLTKSAILPETAPEASVKG